jgi:fructokinase
MLSALGKDPDGLAARRVLDEWKIDGSLVQEHDALPTGRVTVNMTGDRHTFTIHSPAAWDEIAEPRLLPEHDVFCYATLAGRSSRSLKTLESLLQRTAAFKALDVNLRPPNLVDDALAVGVRAATVIKVNDDEFGRTAAALGWEAEPAAYFAAVPSLRWLAVTFGADGAELHARDGGHWRVRGRKVHVVDTVGAGDAFFAGLIDSGKGGRAALDCAQDAAIESVQRRGGLPPH